MKNKKIFYINLIYYICMLSVALIFILSYFDVLTSGYLSTFLIQGIVMLAMPIILYSLFVSKNVKTTFKDFGFKKISFNIFINSIALGLILFFVNNYVADMFYSLLTMFGYDPSINISLNVQSSMLKDLFLTAIVPGFCEEVLHRGMFMRGCEKQGYTRYGLLFSSILFGLMHLNIQQFFYAMILGGLMGIVVIFSDSIYPSMIIHFMNNALSTYFAYGTQQGWKLAKLKNYIEDLIFSCNFTLCILIIGAIIAGLLYLYILFLRLIARDKNKSKSMQLAKELQIEDLNYPELEAKLNEVEQVLEKSPSTTQKIADEGKLNFTDKIFLYSSLILGALITISTFLWGVL